MRCKKHFGFLAIAVLAALVFTLAVALPGVSADGDEDRKKYTEDKKKDTEDQGQEEALPIPEKASLKYPKLGSRLDQLVLSVEEEKTMAEEAAADTPVHREESVAVTIYLSGNVDDVVGFLEDNGGDPRNVGEDYIEAYVPVSLLGPVSEQTGVIRVREIVPPQPEYGPITSQGVQAHLSAAWNQAGYTGQGIKVGIIDGPAAFTGYSARIGSELPTPAGVRCYTDIGRPTRNLADCEDEVDHGTAVAESLVDIAPDVSLYIATPSSAGDLHSTVDWMVSQGVSVVAHVQSYTFDGPGDGTSPFSNSPLKAVDRAVGRGIIWVAPAGNHARGTWFSESPSIYTSSSIANVDVVAFDGADDFHNGLIGKGDRIRVQLRWGDRWGGASSDVDLLLWDNVTRQFVARSENFQTGLAGHYPYERVSHLLIEDRLYHIFVIHRSGSVPDWIQVMVWGVPEIEHYTKNGSIGSPAESANPGLLAVGAAHWDDVRAIEPYSSRGPTPDGRVKPDVVGADCGATSLRPLNEYNSGFCGTSQASSHVAGLAALVRQRFPDYSPAQVAGYLKDNAEQRQSPDPNYTWGHGFAQLSPPEGATRPTAPTLSNAFTRNPAADFNTLDAAGNSAPGGIWSDGTTMWVADWFLGKKIYAYNLATKARVPGRDFNTLDADTDRPSGIWSDGTTMWVSDWLNDKIYAYDMATKARVPGREFNTLDAAGNRSPRGIWSDGTTMWVADWIDEKIYAYNMATKARVPGKDFDSLNARNRDPEGIWSDSETMWVVDDNRGKIYAYDLATKARVPGREFNTLDAAGNTQPEGIWSDGTTMWVSDWIDEKIYAYNMPQVAILEASPATAVPNQAITVNGRGFTVGGTINAANDGSEVTLGGDDAALSRSAGGFRNFNSGQVVTVDSGGSWSATIIVPITDATTTPGTHELEVMDSGNRSGSVEITIPERTLTIEPTEARPGETVTLTGTGFPASNTRTKEHNTPSVEITYSGTLVGTAIPDGDGNITLSFRVPLDAAIPSTNRVEANYDIPGTSTQVEAFVNHTVLAPHMGVTASATRSFSPASVAPGGQVTVTITAANYGIAGRVTETLPAGFSYVSSTHGSVTHPVDGNSQKVRFTLLRETSFTYTVTAPSVEDSYTFSGTLRDSGQNDHVVGGADTVTVSSGNPLLLRYDTNGDGVIQLDEVYAAIDDYFDGALTLDEVYEIIDLYFRG